MARWLKTKSDTNYVVSESENSSAQKPLNHWMLNGKLKTDLKACEIQCKQKKRDFNEKKPLSRWTEYKRRLQDNTFAICTKH